ncbi:PSD1 and planctomycete cytochrome C domain-containing protein [Chryseolinea sp. T2]|uniref:PSD1 and planctomycete cytochrome C domain-containing protein n=1 Tax=Chryseolinea sp. T2 TaxID=3129255 RepID=UPI003076CBFF
MIVHFPISLILVVFLLEALQWVRKTLDMRAAIRVLLVVSVLSSIAAVVFGLLLANTETYGSDILPVHQWAGIATMILAIACWWASRSSSVQVFRTLLILTVVSVMVAGHYGASLTHGEDYLSGAFHQEEPESDEQTMAIVATSGPLNDAQVQELNLQVRTILAHECFNCHGQAKVKGELRLDTKDHLFKGGKHGAVVVPGKPSDSELIRRVKLPRNHKDAMPEKGDGLSAAQIKLLEFWIEKGAPWPDGPLKSIYRVAALEPRMPDIPAVAGNRTAPVDRFVDAYFAKNSIAWPAIVDDHTYIRRVYLDAVGLIPPADSIDAFVKDSRKDKRERLVKSLLSRNDDYARHWLTFWNDALRNDYSGTGYITGGRSDITAWLYTSLKENKPYDQFVRQLISPSKKSKGFIEGIKWRGTVNASQRTEMQAAQNVSQVFLGLNLKCASCHDSFISDWKLDDAYAFANIFADTTLEINRCDKPTGKFAARRVIFKELGEINAEAVTSERLKQLADFLVQPKDGRLARTLVNRMWAQLMGRGLVEPVDVMDNEPWSQDLLDWLASDFVATGYDLRQLLQKIMTSETYQLPTVPLGGESLLTAQDFVFKGMVKRRLTAEQFSDAVSSTVAAIYPDTLVMKKLLPASAFSDALYARASLVKNDPFLTALGRPNRETVSTSRSSQANLLQALELTNGEQYNAAIKRGATEWRNKYADPGEMVNQLYRNMLGRMPDDAERKVAKEALGNRPSVEQIQDLIWAMTLHPEFQIIN